MRLAIAAGLPPPSASILSNNGAEPASLQGNVSRTSSSVETTGAGYRGSADSKQEDTEEVKSLPETTSTHQTKTVSFQIEDPRAEAAKALEKVRKENDEEVRKQQSIMQKVVKTLKKLPKLKIILKGPVRPPPTML